MSSLQSRVSDSGIRGCPPSTNPTMSLSSKSLRFDLRSGGTKCISEDMRSNAVTVGKYEVVNTNPRFPVPDHLKLTVWVTSPRGNNYHHGDDVESGEFAFTAAESGDYTTCFWAKDHDPETTMAVEFEWKSGLATKGLSNVARRERVDEMQLELKKLLDTIQSIHDEMFHLREREEEMQQLNRSTSKTMTTLGFFTLLFSLSVAGWQFWYLKAYFQRKKLI